MATTYSRTEFFYQNNMIKKIKIGVYRIYHKCKPTIYYIGSTSCTIGFSQRFAKHKSDMRLHKHGNIYLQRIHDKYGLDGFVFEIIEKCEKEKCIEREQYWIDYFDSYNKGYNLAEKANGGPTLTFDFRRKMTTKQHKIVYQIDKSDNIIYVYDGVHEAGRISGINSADISTCCHKRNNMAGGFLWCFKDDYNSSVKYKSKYNNSGVFQFDLSNNLIKKWDSIKQASLIYSKGHNGNIVNCCAGKLKSAYGYIWRYNNK